LQPRELYLETCAAHAGVDGRDKPGHDGTGAFLWINNRDRRRDLILAR
jgi:hypothetical protein